MAGNRKLLIPVYLNQRIVFDLIAMLQGGISTVAMHNAFPDRGLIHEAELSSGDRFTIYRFVRASQLGK